MHSELWKPMRGKGLKSRKKLKRLREKRNVLKSDWSGHRNRRKKRTSNEIEEDLPTRC
ncbi:hypothetical protein DPMN_043918 [Dreissena polymorpha]|uniref:Uncharacterized protein n=1 Tax=Dreissena polymorpha TaxID=45954 RepID=A0A9D4HW18_DREPO|nr:hypothetical protein DPMN_043918 [Dreissena polymorpha]